MIQILGIAAVTGPALQPNTKPWPVVFDQRDLGFKFAGVDAMNQFSV
ncbi:MAG: hypothetical protein QNK37_11385 [Acidobacteriota bacterium]|nr:hypothetical protein [Acidobacteriota bacterium]